MKKSGTLPSIKQKQLILNPSKSKQTYRRLQNKIISHDQEITKNEKVISTLANQFRILKEQLQFEQQYSQQYKTAIQKYQEEGAKLNKLVKEQKATISKLEFMLKDKDKLVEAKSKEIKTCKEKDEEYLRKMEELQRTIEENNKNLKKRQQQIKLLLNEKETIKKQLKQKNKQLKERQNSIKKDSESARNPKEQKLKALQQQIQLLNTALEKEKENSIKKERQLQKLGINVLSLQQRLRNFQKNESKLNNYGQEIKNLSQINEELKKEGAQQQKKIQDLKSTLRSLQAKSSSNFNEKIQQFNLEKKELLDKLSQLQKKCDDLAKKRQIEIEQKQKRTKQNSQLKNLLLDFESKLLKLTKSKEDIIKQSNKLRANIMCDFCGKIMKNPVTNIPCGHSYCQQCRKGYQKECKKCPGLKREAVYRNQLLDEIIQASNLVQKIVTFFPS